MSGADNHKDLELERKMLDAVSGVVEGTDWKPPDGGVLVDVLVCMIHVGVDGVSGMSWISAGSMQQAEGMARSVIRRIALADEAASSDD